MSVPVAEDTHGLPIGVQLMARHFNERVMLNVAQLLKIALAISIAVHCACAYRYTALRIGTVVTVPEHGLVAPEQLAATVYYTTYVVTMTKGGDEAKKNNAAVEALLKGR
jgi:hypothetical protein